MLLQTNSYVVPRDRKGEHGRLVRRFRQTFARLGCDSFEVYEQVGANWSAGESSGRYVQIMRFRDRRHQLAVQEAERNDPDAQALIAEFCDLINFAYQRQQGLFAVGFYIGVLPSAPRRQAELVDKTATADELEEETAEEQKQAAEAAKKAAAPVKPPALVEPGAATRAPIVTPVTAGQVPIITPAPAENGVPSDVEITTSPDDGEQISAIDFDADVEAELPPVEASHAEVESAHISAELGTEEPAEAPFAGRWQTSDEIEDAIDPDADLSLDLSDVDESGNIRVADPELLKAESDFAEFVADPVGAFDELKGKPPVLEGTVLDDIHGKAVPMNDDDALAALEDAESAPKINGQSGLNHLDDELEKFGEIEHEGEIDELAPLETDETGEHKAGPSKHDEIHN
jgi:hypothetical protein